MAGQMTSLPTKMVSSCSASSGLSNQCKFFSPCLKKTNTKRGGPTPPPPPTSLCHGGGMSQLVRPRVNVFSHIMKHRMYTSVYFFTGIKTTFLTLSFDRFAFLFSESIIIDFHEP